MRREKQKAEMRPRGEMWAVWESCNIYAGAVAETRGEAEQLIRDICDGAVALGAERVSWNSYRHDGIIHTLATYPVMRWVDINREDK